MVNIKIRLIIFFAAKDGEALYSQQNQDQELIMAQIMTLFVKFRLKLKKVEKTTRSFRYDLNQIPYDYTVEVRNRFKGLGPIDKSAHVLSHVQLFETLWTLACQAPLSMRFPRQEYWSGLPLPPPWDLPDPGTELTSPTSSALAGRFLITEPSRKLSSFK